MTFAQPHDFPPDERDFIAALARECALALERARLYAAEQRARHDAEALARDNDRLLREAQEALQQRDRFLAAAAHELKTPLTSLQGFAQLSLRQFDRNGSVSPGTLRRTLEALNVQTQKLSRLLTHLFDVSRIENGLVRLDRRAGDLRALVHAVVEQVRSGHDHPITVRAPQPVPAVFDATHIGQVVANLLNNALRYSPNREVVEIDLSLSDPQTARLVVTDHGLGIPVERRDHLFDRYYQAHDDSQISGLGLGLYISREFVRLHGGHLRAEFPEEGGTRFVVELPTGLARPEALP